MSFRRYHAAVRNPPARLSVEVSLVREAFDADFYLARYPDIAEAEGIDPVEHYCLHGWKERRDPSPVFSTSYYLEANPDVRDAGINPFLHYLFSGKDEGQQTVHPSGNKAAFLSNMAPLEENASVQHPKQTPIRLLSASKLFSKLSMAFTHGAEGLMLSVSHDNYREITGGVQYCIQREEVTASQRRFTYLHLSPYQPRVFLAPADKTADALVTIVLDGQKIGVTKMSFVIEAVERISGDGIRIEVVVHHLMGHRLEQIAELIRAMGNDRCWLWIHDFFTLCPSYALQRNDVAFCGAPELSSNTCFLCSYGQERPQHHKRVSAFFKEFSVHAIAPSKFAADFWSNKTGLEYASLNTVDHMKVQFRRKCAKQPASDGPITVAFVGFPAVHKGWPVFISIVREMSERKPDIRFLYFGTSDIRRNGLETVYVKVSVEDPTAMIDALAKEDVDFVFHWPSCAETFSFSAHEAFAAGAYVLTNPGSGNIAAVVKRLGYGAVLNDEADLRTFLENGRLENLVEEVRIKCLSRLFEPTYSNMTFDIMDSERWSQDFGLVAKL